MKKEDMKQTAIAAFEESYHFAMGIIWTVISKHPQPEHGGRGALGGVDAQVQG